MKKFLNQNWYRLSICISLLLFSFGFLIWSIKNNTAGAQNTKHESSNSPIAGEGYYESSGALYRVSYWRQGEKWQASKVLDFPTK
jgi:hypothetical protein